MVCLYVFPQDYLSASSDLQEVLQLDLNVQEAEQELETVTNLLRESLLASSQGKVSLPTNMKGETKTSPVQTTVCRKSVSWNNAVTFKIMHYYIPLLAK